MVQFEKYLLKCEKMVLPISFPCVPYYIIFLVLQDSARSQITSNNLSVQVKLMNLKEVMAPYCKAQLRCPWS
ncbi:hypothetical protein EB796_001373 [Bugula neritina]|uniref:Uncharacterized protein n=1 Tax=Bugula neritina TaxID=10212 RepID=A0A7J7KQ50_BUGNE|nr:hypothetical protein EB796_001373 [Bugula neritina]